MGGPPTWATPMSCPLPTLLAQHWLQLLRRHAFWCLALAEVQLLLPRTELVAPQARQPVVDIRQTCAQKPPGKRLAADSQATAPGPAAAAGGTLGLRVTT